MLKSQMHSMAKASKKEGGDFDLIIFSIFVLNNKVKQDYACIFILHVLALCI